MQQAMTAYEHKILNDMKKFTEKEQAKLSRIFHLIMQEMIIPQSDERRMTEEFLFVCGTWEDDRSPEEQIQDIYSARKSAYRTEKIFEIYA